MKPNIFGAGKIKIRLFYHLCLREVNLKSEWLLHYFGITVNFNDIVKMSLTPICCLLFVSWQDMFSWYGVTFVRNVNDTVEMSLTPIYCLFFIICHDMFSWYAVTFERNVIYYGLIPVFFINVQLNDIWRLS
jgi:uncharacterized membrane protein